MERSSCLHHQFPHKCLSKCLILQEFLRRTQGLWYLQFCLAVELLRRQPILHLSFMHFSDLRISSSLCHWHGLTTPFLSSFTFLMCVNSVDLFTNPLTSLLLEILSRPLNVYQILHQLCPTVLKFHFREDFFTHTVSTWSSFNANVELN